MLCKKWNISHFLVFSFLTLGVSNALQASLGYNYGGFYGVEENTRLQGLAHYRFALRNFRKDKVARQSSLLKADLQKGTGKIEKLKGHYKAFNMSKGAFYDHEFVLYKPRGLKGKKVPLIIIVPPVVGITPLDYMTASYFAHYGMASVVLKLNVPNGKLQINLDQVGLAWESYIDKVRAFIDIAYQLPGVDFSRIGIKGLSLGGITAGIAMGRDPRIKAGVIFMGGVDLPVIMAYSEQAVVKKIRRKKMKELGLTSKEEYEELLKQKVKIRLPFLTMGRRSRDFYLFVASEDTYVPEEVQLSLRRRLSFPETTFLKKGHVVNGIFYSVHLKKMKDYFKNRFSL